jgi:pimeloyl-ACP methyl ester carboxylesterase
MNIVHHKIYGESNQNPVYILHGIFGMLDNWHLIANELASDYQVVTIDARNHGKSFHHPDASYLAMVQDIETLMNHLGHDQISLLGHSMGGKTAMLFADINPQKLKQLIVADIAPKKYFPGHLEYFKAFKDIDFSTIQSRKEAESAFEPYAPQMSVRQFLLKNLEPDSQGGYKLKINIEAIENHYLEVIGAIEFQHVFNKPVDFILGEKSGYLKTEDKPYIEAHFPQAQYHLVEGAGHWVHADNPKQFLQILQDVLKK